MFLSPWTADVQPDLAQWRSKIQIMNDHPAIHEPNNPTIQPVAASTIQQSSNPTIQELPAHEPKNPITQHSSPAAPCNNVTVQPCNASPPTPQPPIHESINP